MNTAPCPIPPNVPGAGVRLRRCSAWVGLVGTKATAGSAALQKVREQERRRLAGARPVGPFSLAAWRRQLLPADRAKIRSATGRAGNNCRVEIERIFDKWVRRVTGNVRLCRAHLKPLPR